MRLGEHVGAVGQPVPGRVPVHQPYRGQRAEQQSGTARVQVQPVGQGDGVDRAGGERVEDPQLDAGAQDRGPDETTHGLLDGDRGD